MIATLIALTSLLGAVAVWRASVASGAASDAERKGFADMVAHEQDRSQALANVAAGWSRYLRAKEYEAEAVALARQVRRASRGDAARLASLQSALVTTSKSALVPIRGDLAPSGKFDYGRAFTLEWQGQTANEDVDPQPELARADRLNRKGERLVALTVLLIGAALFLTLAQVSKRRVHRVYLVGGVAVLIVATTLLGVVELR